MSANCVEYDDGKIVVEEKISWCKSGEHTMIRYQMRNLLGAEMV